MPANSSTWPPAPTSSEAVFAARTAAMIALASSAEISAPLPARLIRANATVPSALMGEVASAVASNAGSSCAANSGGRPSGIPPPISGQSRPMGSPYGLVTQVTDSRAATSCRSGVMACSTAGSVTVPVVGDQTIRAALSPPALGGIVESISVAIVDSVSGNANESLSSPPRRVPARMTTPIAMNQATMAQTGLRTAQRDRAPMRTPLTSGDQLTSTLR